MAGPSKRDAFPINVDIAFQMYAKADDALASGKLEQARLLLVGCRKLVPEWYQPLTVLGYTWMLLGRPEKAVASWRRVLESGAEPWQAGSMLAGALAERDAEGVHRLAADLTERYLGSQKADRWDRRAALAAEALAQVLRIAADAPAQVRLAKRWQHSTEPPGPQVGALMGLAALRRGDLAALRRGDLAAARRHWRAGLLSPRGTPHLGGLLRVRLPADEGLRILLRGGVWLAQLGLGEGAAPWALDFPFPAGGEPQVPVAGAWEAVQCLGLARGKDAVAGQGGIRRLVRLPGGRRLSEAAAAHAATPRRVSGWMRGGEAGNAFIKMSGRRDPPWPRLPNGGPGAKGLTGFVIMIYNRARGRCTSGRGNPVAFFGPGERGSMPHARRAHMPKDFLIRQGIRECPLVEVGQPNLLREQFPYEEPPKILFDGYEVPMDLPEEIVITDTTFRDGQQARPPYTVEQIVTLYDLLHRLGGPQGVIRQSEFFLYSEKDREAVRRCQELGHRYPEITGWIRAVREDFRLARDMNLRETGILTSASDYHIFLKLGWNRRQAMDRYLEVVEAVLEAGIRPRLHIEDVTRADIYGFVVPFVQRALRLAEGGRAQVKIRLCDTMGYGVPYPGASLPRSVPRLVHTMVHEAGVPREDLEWHGHNDFYKVLINGSYAWLYGCAAVNGALLGFGERTGNTPTEGLIFEYYGLLGQWNGVDPTVVTDIAEYLERECGYRIPPMTPFVGSHFNVTAAGIHADGLIKNEEIYNIFDTKKILKRPLSVNLTDKSGTAGVAYWVNSYLHLPEERWVSKNHPGVLAIHRWVAEQYAAGRTTTISSEEMLEQAERHLPDRFIQGGHR